MPEGLLPALGWAAGLLSPVLVLLFVALRLRRKARYPHELLAPGGRTVRADFLPRTFRLYYDAVIDGLCALAIAAAIAGFPGPRDRGTALVLDCSRSMLAGVAGNRPLDEAVRLALSEEYTGAELFVLGFDPERARPSLGRLPASARLASTPDALAAALEASVTFFSVDYGLMGRLVRRGYTDIVLLTDELGPAASGFTARESGFREGAAVHAATRSWSGGRSVSRWVVSGGAAPTGLRRVEAGGALAPVAAAEWGIEALPGGFRLSVASPGAYALAWETPGGQAGLVPFMAAPPPPVLSARGPVSETAKAALDAWTDAVHGRSRDEYAFTLRDGGGRARPDSVSVADTDAEPLILSPASVLGAVVAAGYDPDADLALGRAGMSSGEASLAWLSAVSAGARAAEAARLAAGASGGLVPLGEGLRSRESPGGRVTVLSPPSSEYWRPSPGGTLALERPEPPRIPAALVLAALYALKLALHRKFRPARGARSAGPST